MSLVLIDLLEPATSCKLANILHRRSNETRAWTFKEGTNAPGAAGIIHTDFEKGSSEPKLFLLMTMFCSQVKVVPKRRASGGLKVRITSSRMGT